MNISMKSINSINIYCFYYLKIDNSYYNAIGGVLSRVKITCVWGCFFIHHLTILQYFYISEAVLFWFLKRKYVFFTAEKTLYTEFL